MDPWRVETGNGVKSRLAEWVASRTEGASLGGVSGLFAVSERIISDLTERFPAVRNLPAGAAPYGFEASDLVLAAAKPAQALDSRPPTPAASGADLRHMVYIGALSDSQLPVLEALLDALVALRSTDPVVAGRLRLQLIGTTYAAPPRAAPRAAALITQRGLGDQVVEHRVRVPYLDALGQTAAADANLVLGDLTTYYAALKLMPLLAARRPVLAFLHVDSEPAVLLRRLGARGLVCYGTPTAPSPSAAVHALASTLVDFVHDRIPILDSDFVGDSVLSERTAERMTGALASVLDRVAANPRAGS